MHPNSERSLAAVVLCFGTQRRRQQVTRIRRRTAKWRWTTGPMSKQRRNTRRGRLNRMHWLQHQPQHQHPQEPERAAQTS